jgi:hypothetical protein
VESGGNIYRLWSSGGLGNEYFLVENRQKIGYDAYLPNSGLLIWHIDETQYSNDNQWYPGYTSNGNYLVALEQADGLYEMEKNISVGNSGDPFPGSANKISFTSITGPNSNSYAGENTYVGVNNISASVATMTADFQVAFAAGLEWSDKGLLPCGAQLGQNYPNPFNPSTSIDISLQKDSEIKLNIYDILGRQVRNLLDNYYRAGEVTALWDGKDNNGNQVPSGIYLYKLITDDGELVKKMLLLK